MSPYWGRSSLLFCLCILCHGLFALPLGDIGRLGSVIVALPRHLLYYFTNSIHYCPKLRLYVVNNEDSDQMLWNRSIWSVLRVCSLRDDTSLSVRKRILRHRHPSATQISHRRVHYKMAAESSLSAWRNFAFFGYPKYAQWRFWSDCADVRTHVFWRYVSKSRIYNNKSNDLR